MTQLQARSTPLEQLARLIRRLDRRQKAALLQLVPELQTIRADEAALPAGQSELLAYFDAKIAALPEAPPWRDSEPFLGDLTVAEFFAAPEAEQARIWDAAHAEAYKTLSDYEHPTHADALSAR